MDAVASVGLLGAFLAGLVSFLSPCVLPLVPGYLAFIAGTSLDELRGGARGARWFSTLLLSALFVLGFSAVFIAFGAAASAASAFLRTHQEELNYAAGGLIVLFGLYLAVGLPLPLIGREFRLRLDLPGGRPLSALLLGFAFAFGWTPCIGPVLGAILTIAATQEGTGSGVLLLSFYSLGLGVPFLLAALSTDWFVRRLPRWRRAGRYLQAAAGVVLVAMGAAIIAGRLSVFAFWLLEHFPALGRIG